METNGAINVYKEKGYTSHDAVNIIKRTLKAKTGHTGTLDPAATGVLPIVLSYSTKLSDYIMGTDKVYEAEIHFGITTDTQDMSGNILLDNRPIQVEKRDFLEVLNQFTGEISQVPPMYSAIKIGGEKLYNLARKGIEVERKPRNVTIHSIDLIHFDCKMARIRVNCSKGTYVRTLCADIGAKLGSGAAMGELLRTRSGDFSIKNSLKLDEVKSLFAEGKLADYIIMPEEILKTYSPIYAHDEAIKPIKNGNTFSYKFIYGQELKVNEKYRLYINKEQFIGLYTLRADGFLKPDIILTDLQRV